MPQMIFDDPDGMLGMLRDSVQTFASSFPGPQRLRQRRDKGVDLDRDVWTGMAEAGWLGLTLPEELGGSGLGAREQAVLSEALGRELISEPVAFLAVFSGALLTGSMDNAERARMTEGLVEGSLIVSPAVQGEDGTATALRAEQAGENISLKGASHYVNAAASADEFLVYATSDGESLLISVPASSAKVALRPTLDGSQLGKVTFDGATVGAERILARGAEVEAAIEAATAATRIALAAELAGIASRGLELTVSYTSERVQFGKPIAAFQVIQHRLVDMWADAEFACSTVVYACERVESDDASAAALSILAAKARAGDAAVTVGRRAVHLHGAMGFTDECDIGLFMKRADALNSALGQPENLRLQFVALERAA